MIITIIPDTNVLINSLEIIKRFLEEDHLYHIRIYILRNVLIELDKLKMKLPKAKRAISFIKDFRGENLDIEGSVNDKKMDIVDDMPDLPNIPVDLLIVKSAANIENSVILTADKNMILFCRSKNVKAIYTGDISYEKLKLEIYISHTNMEEMEIIEESLVCDKKLTEQCLRPTMLRIIEQEIGPGVELYRDKISNYTIEQLIDFIIKNFCLFEKFISKNSKRILIQFNRDLRDKDHKDDIKKGLQNILTIFRINYKL